MFDLETTVSQWRRQVKLKWKGDQSALAELEDHLREEIAALVQCGNSEENAWRTATSKLGDPAAIDREFSKVNRLPALDRFAFGFILAAGVLALTGLVIMMVKMGSKSVADPVLATHVFTITLGYMIGLLAATFAGYGTIRGFVARSPMPDLRSATVRVVRIASLVAVMFTILGFVLGVVWNIQEHIGMLSADPREIGAVLVVISFAAATATVWRSAVFGHVSLATAITGGGIILVAWIGVMAQASGYPALLTTIGIGGLIGSLALAALSLANRDRSGACG